MITPEGIKKHAGDYRPDAWREYSAEELRWWVHLLNKRAGMRTDPAKAEKDRTDARNYQAMLDALEQAER